MSRELVSMKGLLEEISMGPFGSNIKVDCFVKSGTPVLNGRNVSGIKLIENVFNYVTPEKAKSLGKANAKRGDIVITHRGTLGQICYIPENSKFDNYIISQSQFRVRLKTDFIYPPYFVYYFHTNEGQKRLLASKNHVGVPALAQATSNFKIMEFPLIKLNIQKKIAHVLSTLDKKIELNNQINEQLEAMAKLIYDYWFVQFDFPDENGKPYKSSGGKMVYDEVLKREIPEGWEVKTFGGYAKVSSGFAFKSSWWTEKGVPVLKIKDIKENFSIDTNDLSYVSKENANSAIKFKSSKGNLVIAMTGATIGKFGIIPETTNGIYINQRVGLYHLGKNPLEKLPFLINSMRQNFFRQKIIQRATGAAQPNISGDQLNKLPLIRSNNDLEDNFNKTQYATYCKILSNKQENQRLSALRDWLLPMLMNGQVTVE